MALTPYDLLDAPLPVAVTNPLGSTLAAPLTAAQTVLMIATVVAAFAGLTVRFRRSAGMERQQVKWMFLGGAATALVLASAISLGPSGSHVAMLAMLPLPAAVAVAVLRYRLLDVDVVIHRSLVYGALTLVLLAAYVGTVGVLGSVLGQSTGAPIVATALVALGLNPTRVRVQRFVNHLLYGDRDEPYAAVNRLGQQLAAVRDSASVVDAAADVVRRALRVSGVAVEVAGELRAAAGNPWGATALRVPLTYRGEDVGQLRVGHRGAREPLTHADERLVADLARHIAVALTPRS